MTFAILALEKNNKIIKVQKTFADENQIRILKNINKYDIEIQIKNILILNQKNIKQHIDVLAKHNTLFNELTKTSEFMNFLTKPTSYMSQLTNIKFENVDMPIIEIKELEVFIEILKGRNNSENLVISII